MPPAFFLFFGLLVTPFGPPGATSSGAVPDEVAQRASARMERTADFRIHAGPAGTTEGVAAVLLERVTTAVPWPRGLVVVGDQLVVLARGRHRSAGGIDPNVDDRCGSLFVVDPDVFEPVIRSEEAGFLVRGNARMLVEPTGAPFRLYDPGEGAPLEANEIDRPYCTLAYDPVSENFFICGYSGVDLPGKRFRKNASDSILRFDMREQAWYVVEQHDPDSVPAKDLGYVVPNQYYPHHDPAKNAAPHGWLNGPDGAVVCGDYLYAAGKDNHTVARYRLSAIRASAAAGPPPSEKVLGRELLARLEGRGSVPRRIEALGASALEAHDGYLYLGFRTSSIVLRFPVDDDGTLIDDPEAGEPVGELIAVFEPWNPETKRSANLIDMAFDAGGRLYVACAQQGRVWNVGRPDPGHVFDGVDVGDSPTANQPYVDLRQLTSNPRARVGNIAFDEDDRLYICSGNYDSGTELAGVVYRAVPARPLR